MKRKILHLTYDMHIGGTEQVIKNLIEGTDKSLYIPSILCIESPIGPFGQMLQEQNIEITTIPRKEGFDISLIRKIRTFIKQNEVDILHCHQYTPWVYGSLAATLTSVKVIFTEHGRFYPDRSSWKRKLVNPVLSSLTHHITAISQATKQALVDFEFLSEKNIQVVYNGIHPIPADETKTKALRQQLDIPENTFILGTIARLDPIKNHKMMLNAFREVLNIYPDSKLIIVGDGVERSNLESQALQLDIKENIIFTGYEPKPHILLDLMDIFLLSSFSEGTSMTLLEAMALSKPCIVTDVGGNPEIIKNNYNGIVTENNNAKEFAIACQTLIKNISLRKTMAENARSRFEKLFNAKIMCEKYQSITKSLLSITYG